MRCQQPLEADFGGRFLANESSSSFGSSPHQIHGTTAVLSSPSADGCFSRCCLRYCQRVYTMFLKNKNKNKKTEEHVQISYTEGRGKFSGRGKSPNVKHSVWCEREKTAKFSWSSRGCLQGVNRGDNENRDGPTDRERQPREERLPPAICQVKYLGTVVLFRWGFSK